MKFLIDECLTPELVRIANASGFVGSSHVVWMGLAGRKDWELKPIILNGDWTFVTRNAVDFRGPVSAPGTRGQYAKVALHAGLICLNAYHGMDIDLQIEMFEAACGALKSDPDLINRVLEITVAGDEFHILRYAMPAEDL